MNANAFLLLFTATARLQRERDLARKLPWSRVVTGQVGPWLMVGMAAAAAPALVVVASLLRALAWAEASLLALARALAPALTQALVHALVEV